MPGQSEISVVEPRLEDQGNASTEIDRDILIYQDALNTTVDTDSIKPALLARLGICLNSRFRSSYVLADLHLAISSFRKSVELSPDNDEARPSRLHNLGLSLSMRFQVTGNLVDIEEAISSVQDALAIIPNGCPDECHMLTTLGISLRGRFECLGALSDLNESSLCEEKAIKLIPRNHPSMPIMLNNLGNALLLRSQEFGRSVDLQDAILNLQEAIKLTSDNDTHLPSRLINCGRMLATRFNQTQDQMDIEASIRHLQRAILLIPSGHWDEPTALVNYGIAVLSRFERFDNLEDVDEAILNLQKAVELAQGGHKDRPSILIMLANAFLIRFQRRDKPSDLDSTILYYKEVINLIQDGHLERPRALGNLGIALTLRFERFGELEDIESSISSHQMAIDLTSDEHADKPAYLINIGGALLRRFERLGSLPDIENAILKLQAAVKLIPTGHKELPSVLSNLGTAFKLRFDRLLDPSDVDEAILLQKHALELTPEGHHNKPFRYSNLALALKTRFEVRGSIEDLEKAILNQREATQIDPNGDPREPSWHSNLGIMLQLRFERTGNIMYIDNSISSQQRAIQITPDDHPDKTAQFSNLGAALLKRFESLHDPKDVKSSILAYSNATNSPTGPPMMRFYAARMWAKAATDANQSPLPAFKHAIDLLPRMAWLGLTVTDQHAILAQVGDVVRDAVASAIDSKQYETAVEWAEQGRSIVWQNMLGLRTQLDDLHTARPDLAERLQTISKYMQGSIRQNIESDDTYVTPLGSIARRYSELAVEWDNIVKEIRLIPAFEAFLQAKSFIQLIPAANDGPVVILNVHSSRCDALVLNSEELDSRKATVNNIPLKGFSEGMSQWLYRCLLNLLSSAGARFRGSRQSEQVNPPVNDDASLKDILGELWMHVVKPVIEGLSCKVKPGSYPRLWWCATGPLAFLPIHAAGIYDEAEGGDKIFDYVVSSYTPTLTAILGPSQTIVKEDFRILTVAYPSKSKPIPKTLKEVEIIKSIASELSVKQLTNEDATVEGVLQGMRKSSWVHLACHGQQNIKNPMKSGFLLHGEKSLRLEDIISERLPKLEFAFLSACQTATGDERIAEESVHLAAGLFLSGCKGLIATIWSIQDEDAPVITKGVYTQILKDGAPDRKEAAYALHEAVKGLRESGAGFLSWVPFIHMGR